MLCSCVENDQKKRSEVVVIFLIENAVELDQNRVKKSFLNYQNLLKQFFSLIKGVKAKKMSEK